MIAGPVISVVYEATVLLPVSLPDLVAAFQVQVNRDFQSIWNRGCTLVIEPRVGLQQWGLVFLDDADQANALGYHELSADGAPLGKVFVRTTLDDAQDPCVTASHELLEMLVDPGIDQTATRYRDARVYALEVCDAVEETTYAIDGITVSNFQTPQWFGLPPFSGMAGYDFLAQCVRPFELLKGGYSSIIEDGDWVQIFGSVRGADAFRADEKWRPQARESGVMRRSTR